MFGVTGLCAGCAGACRRRSACGIWLCSFSGFIGLFFTGFGGRFGNGWGGFQITTGGIRCRCPDLAGVYFRNLNGTGHGLTSGHLAKANAFTMWRAFAGAMCICHGRIHVILLGYFSVNLATPVLVMIGTAWYMSVSWSFAISIWGQFSPVLIWAACSGYVRHCDFVGHSDIVSYRFIFVVSREISHWYVLWVGYHIFPGIWYRVLGIRAWCQAISRRGDILIWCRRWGGFRVSFRFTSKSSRSITSVSRMVSEVRGVKGQDTVSWVVGRAGVLVEISAVAGVMLPSSACETGAWGVGSWGPQWGLLWSYYRFPNQNLNCALRY